MADKKEIWVISRRMGIVKQFCTGYWIDAITMKMYFNEPFKNPKTFTKKSALWHMFKWIDEVKKRYPEEAGWYYTIEIWRNRE